MRAPLLTAGIFLLAACRSGGTPPPVDPRTEVEGGRAAGKAVRSSDSRPRAFEETHPLRGERLELDQARVQRRLAEQGGMTGEDARLSPAVCAALEQSHPCPLLALPWRARELPLGLELTVELSPSRGRVLQDRLRCFQLYHQGKSREETCLDELAGARIQLQVVRGAARLTLLAPRDADVAGLRARVRRVIDAGP
ncbi:MAG: hypothetical protein IT371_05120 [Deltaproteobacteria bacterium]|nr:hypothetical protein [Deltaproteobacteria bacterium]